MADDPVAMANPPDWNERYANFNTPWDTGEPSSELIRILATGQIRVGRAIELGCGTGANSIYLAEQGFKVTGIDVSGIAIKAARQRAEQAGVKVEFIAADVGTLAWPDEPADFVFDRGCYHCVRRNAVEPYLNTLAAITKAGSKMLVLAGNAKEARVPGPPTVSEADLRHEFGNLFTIERLQEFRFDDAVKTYPLAWSCLMVRNTSLHITELEQRIL